MPQIHPWTGDTTTLGAQKMALVRAKTRQLNLPPANVTVRRKEEGAKLWGKEEAPPDPSRPHLEKPPSGATSRGSISFLLPDKMLPVRHNDPVKSSGGPVRRLFDRVRAYARLVLSDANSRNLLGFLVLNLTFAFVELFYGVWTNSLGLISDSFHMFFDCTGLLAGLVASVITKWRADEKFSYG